MFMNKFVSVLMVYALAIGIACAQTLAPTYSGKQAKVQGQASKEAGQIKLAPANKYNVKATDVFSWLKGQESTTVQQQAKSPKHIAALPNVADELLLYGLNVKDGTYRTPSPLPPTVFSFHAAPSPVYKQETYFNIEGAMTGFYAKGKFYAIFTSSDFDEDFNMLTTSRIDVYDATTWGLIDSKYLSQNAADDMASYFRQTSIYDPTTDLAYSVTWGSGKPLVSIDLNTLQMTVIGATDQFIQTLIVDKEGQLYGISFSDQKLYRIDKTTGACTEVGTTDTGMNISANVMSAATDPVTGKVFWSVIDNLTFQSALFTIDLATAHCEKVTDLPGGESFMGLYIPYVDAEAPAAPTGIHYADGQLLMDVPATTYTSGAALTGELSALVSVDGAANQAFEVTAGGTAAIDLPLAEGFHDISICISNAVGQGAARRLNTYVGQDVPAAVTGLTVSADDGKNIQLSWEAPTASVHGGPVDDDAINYSVVRYPDEVVVAEGLKVTSYSEPLPVARNRYYYVVTAYNGTTAGQSATSEKISAGSVYLPPFVEGFDTQEDFDSWTVIDANNDQQTWTYMNPIGGDPYLYMNGNGITDPESGFVATYDDDYIITLPIELKAGNDYRIHFNTYDLWMWHEYMDILLGTGTSITGDETLIAEVDVVADKEYSYLFNVPADGQYRLILHAKTVGNSLNIAIDNFSVDVYSNFEGPDAVTNLVATAGEKGALQNTIEFVAPVKTYKQGELTSISRIDIYRDGSNKAITTFNEPKPGEQLSWIDTDVTNGMHSYKVVAFNEQGQGKENIVENWVGLDVPGAIPNVKARMNESNLAEVTWEKVSDVGQHGGYVNPDDVQYVLCRYDPYNWDNHWPDVTQPTNDFTVTDDSYMGWGQAYVDYELVAFNGAGRSEGEKFGIVLGDPYQLPYHETFDFYGFMAGINFEPWTLIANTYNHAWNTVDGSGLAVKPYEGDLGMLMFAFLDEDSNDQVMTGPRVSLAETTAPELSFYMYHGFEAEPEDLELKVYVNYEDNGWTQVGTIPYNNGTEGWGRSAIQLEAGKRDVQFAFAANAADASAAIYIDAVKIDESVAHEVAIEGISLSKKRVNVGESSTLKVTVSNYGTEEANNYSVAIYRDGTKVAEQDGTVLKNNQTAVIDFPLTTTKHDASKTYVYSAQLEAADDAITDNNQSQEVKLFVKGSSLPTAGQLSGSESKGSVQLTWEAPATDEQTDPVTDDFDDYESFIIEEIGDWTTYDGDGTQTVYFGGPEIAHAFEPKAWQIWAPVEAGFSLERFPVLTPKSGDKVLACWAASNGIDATVPQDDWLISSDVLGGTDISFWYRVPNDGSDPQVFEILYSTTDQEPESFQVLDRDSLGGTTEWRQFEYTLPADAKFFAIRNCSYGSYTVAFIDDITYTPLYGSQSKLTLKGYNVYRDDELIAAEVTETSYIDTPADNKAHVYAVSALWAEGESDLSNDYVSSIVTGIHTANVVGEGSQKIYNMAGQRTNNLRGFRIVTTDGKTRKVLR